MQDPCVYCGGSPSGMDHIIARSAGGADGWQNRAPACTSCDQLKGSVPLAIFLVAWHRARLRNERRQPQSHVAEFRSMVRNNIAHLRRGARIGSMADALLDFVSHANPSTTLT